MNYRPEAPGRVPAAEVPAQAAAGTRDPAEDPARAVFQVPDSVQDPVSVQVPAFSQVSARPVSEVIGPLKRPRLAAEDRQGQPLLFRGMNLIRSSS